MMTIITIKTLSADVRLKTPIIIMVLRDDQNQYTAECQLFNISTGLFGTFRKAVEGIKRTIFNYANVLSKNRNHLNSNEKLVYMWFTKNLIFLEEKW